MDGSVDLNYHFRHTDLALELQEEWEKGSALNGVKVHSGVFCDNRIRETVIEIVTEKAAESFGKPKGKYITLEGEELSGHDGRFHKDMSSRIAWHIGQLVGDRERILIAGLGNAEVTPDALGPRVIKNLLVTRHLKELEGFSKMRSSMSIAPGVMAQTGMETGEILKGVIREAKPEILLVIDALAAKTFDRLNTTVQISDSGIAPGAGVGNRRKEISSHTMGIPVVAVGVPTVISIPAIAGDILSSFFKAEKNFHQAETFQEKSEQEKYRFLADIIDEKLFGFFVTPKEVDESVERISDTISAGLNQVITKKWNKISGQA